MAYNSLHTMAHATSLYNMSATPFYSLPAVATSPYCSVPYSSLDAGRIASLPELSPYDCGTCVELCAWDDVLNLEDRRRCADFMVVDQHGTRTNTNTISPSNAIQIAPHIHTALNVLKLPAYNVSVAETVMLTIVDDQRCKGVWDGTMLSSGALPIGKFTEYMVFEPGMMRDEGSGETNAGHYEVGIEGRKTEMEKREEKRNGNEEVKSGDGKGKGKGRGEVVFSPPKGAEFMVEKGFLKQGVRVGRKFSG